jgi:hypothetical protein
MSSKKALIFSKAGGTVLWLKVIHRTVPPATKQGDEYYQFCSQRTRESGMKENKKIIRAGE